MLTQCLLFLLPRMVWTRNSVIGTVTTLRAGRQGDGHTAGERSVCLLQIPQNGSRAHPASCSVGTGVASRWLTGRDVMSATRLHLGSRLTFGAGIIFLILAHPVYEM